MANKLITIDEIEQLQDEFYQEFINSGSPKEFLLSCLANLTRVGINKYFGEESFPESLFDYKRVLNTAEAYHVIKRMADLDYYCQGDILGEEYILTDPADRYVYVLGYSKFTNFMNVYLTPTDEVKEYMYFDEIPMREICEDLGIDLSGNNN